MVCGAGRRGEQAAQPSYVVKAHPRPRPASACASAVVRSRGFVGETTTTSERDVQSHGRSTQISKRRKLTLESGQNPAFVRPRHLIFSTIRSLLLLDRTDVAIARQKDL